MLTLTLPGDTKLMWDDAENHKTVTAMHKAFMKDLRHFHGDTQYVRIAEAQARGAIHYHDLVNRFLPMCSGPCHCSVDKPCVQALAWKHGFGFVDIRLMPSAEAAANYVIKYLTKGFGGSKPKGAHIYSMSPDDSVPTMGSVHAERVDIWRQRHGWIDRTPAGCERIGTNLVPDPHHLERDIWKRGPPPTPMRDPPAWPTHLAGRLFDHETGEVFPLPEMARRRSRRRWSWRP
jgi:hypothetical protein